MLEFIGASLISASGGASLEFTFGYDCKFALCDVI